MRVAESNVDPARRGAELFNSGDVEWLIPDVHPEVELIPLRAPVQGGYHGHSGLREFFADNAENLDEFHLTVEELIDCDPHVVVIGVLRIRGKGSGLPITTPSASLVTFRDGLVVRFEELRERERALAAARERIRASGSGP
jgi:ketosteroid isomerase-like protein